MYVPLDPSTRPLSHVQIFMAPLSKIPESAPEYHMQLIAVILQADTLISLPSCMQMSVHEVYLSAGLVSEILTLNHAQNFRFELQGCSVLAN